MITAKKNLDTNKLSIHQFQSCIVHIFAEFAVLMYCQKADLEASFCSISKHTVYIAQYQAYIRKTMAVNILDIIQGYMLNIQF